MPIPTQNKFILTIAEAIAHKEGFYAQGSNPAKRNNNPGNLRKWDSNLPEDKQGFTEFPDRKAGFRALYMQIEKNIVERELTLYEFFAGKDGVYHGYAPEKDGNDPFQYSKFVEGFLEDRGFYPLSLEHGLDHWYKDIMSGKDEIPVEPKVLPGITVPKGRYVSVVKHDRGYFGIRIGEDIIYGDFRLDPIDEGGWRDI